MSLDIEKYQSDNSNMQKRIRELEAERDAEVEK
jgi:hypothetical protein